MDPRIQNIWDNIGTAWNEFEDKPLIENFWSALASGHQYLYSHVGNTQFSRVIDLMDGSFDYGPETFYIVYSGTAEEVNVEPETIGTAKIPNTLFEFALPELTYSIPTIAYSYTHNGIAYSGTYIEGTDYVITSGMNTLAWINTPTKDLRYPTMGVIVGTATHLYRINPVLGNVWAAQCKFNIGTNISKYNTFGQEQYKHLKMLLWALQYHQNKAPSVYTLKNAFGISSGCPFAYESGIINYSLVDNLYNVSIGGESYIFPSGILPRVSGYYDKFEILSDGLELYDYITNPILIDEYANPFTRRSTLIYQIDPFVSGLSHSQDFRDTYIERIMPKQVQYSIAPASTIFAGAYSTGVFRSSNKGTTWSTSSIGLSGNQFQALAVKGVYIFVGISGDGVFRSINKGTLWVPTNTGLTNDYVSTLIVSGSYLFAGTNDGIFRSNDNGANWTEVSSGLTNTDILSFTTSGMNLFAGTGGGAFRSTDYGTNWTAINSGLTNTTIKALTVSGAYLFAGTASGLFRSANSGTSWTAVNTGLTNTFIYALGVYGTNIFAGTNGGTFISTNAGGSWSAIPGVLGTLNAHSFFAHGIDFYAGTFEDGGATGHVYRSTNGGVTWAVTGLSTSAIFALAAI